MSCNAEIPVRRFQTRETTANEYWTMWDLRPTWANQQPGPPACPTQAEGGQGGKGQGQGQQPPKATSCWWATFLRPRTCTKTPEDMMSHSYIPEEQAGQAPWPLSQNVTPQWSSTASQVLQ